jgi:GST-like protein
VSAARPARLYRCAGCGSAMVEAAFVLAGQPLTLVEASRWEGRERLPELETLNPLGQVPTLVWPDGTVQSESAAILVELALRHPQAGLLPAEPALRAQALRWLVYLPANIYPQYTIRDFPERWSDDPAVRSALVGAATGRIQAGWQLLEAALAPHGRFAFGDRPGALDLAIAVISRWTPGRAWFNRACPRLAALARAVDRVPALAPVWADNVPPT